MATNSTPSTGRLRTMMAGLIIATVGVVLLLASVVWRFAWTAPDANIGAGLALLGGGVLVGLGVVIAAIAKLSGARSRRHD